MNDRGKSGVWFSDSQTVDDPYNDDTWADDGDNDECHCAECQEFWRMADEMRDREKSPYTPTPLWE